jgi:hypothetical protein
MVAPGTRFLAWIAHSDKAAAAIIETGEMSAEKIRADYIALLDV